MDRIAAALASAVGILLLLIWDQMVQAMPASPNSGVKAIVLVIAVIMGLVIYIRAHASR